MESPLTTNREYRRAEHLADSAVHVVGIALGIAGVVWLAFLLLPKLATLGERLSVAVYAIALLGMLSASAAYNMWPLTPLKSWLRRIDHGAIFVMIAGTYTPFIAQMPSGWTPLILFVVIWSVAIAGLVLKLAMPGHLERLTILLYLALGWSGVAAYLTSPFVLDEETWRMLGLGGMIYSAGVAFHVSERLPFHKAIWHVFVLGGALCHYIALLALV